MPDPKTTPVARMQAEGRNPGDGGETGTPDSAALHPGYGTRQQLPHGWLSTTIGEISSPKQWPTISQDVLSKSGYPVFGANGLIGYYTRFTHEKPTVAVTCRGSTCGTIHVTLPFSYITGNAMALDGLNEELVDSRILAAILRFQGLRDCITGSAQPQIIGSDLRRVRISLPPKNEQRRIAEILDTLDNAIQKTERLIAKLKQIKQGLLHDLLTRGIDENARLRDPIAHPEQFKDSVLGRIPLEWSVLSLASVVADIPHAIVDGPFGSNLKTEHYRERGVPVIQSGFVTSGEFQADSYVYVDQSLVEAQKRSIAHPGDIIMAKIGTQCGACAVMPDGHSEGILAGNSLKISLDSSVCRTQYALKVFHYYHDTGVLDLIKTETAQPAISLRNLKSLLLPIPSVDEQDRIIAVLNAQERRKLDEIKSLRKLREVRKGLMHDLLTGKVRTPVYKELENVW